MTVDPSVVLVSPGYPPMRGGVETHVQRLATGLAAAGCAVEVWTHGREVVRSGAAVDEQDGVRVRWFDTTRSHRFPVSGKLFAAARRELAQRPPDVVHVHAYHAVPAASALLLPQEVPVVFTPHFHGDGHTLLARLAHIPYGAIGRRIFDRADRVVAVSGSEGALITSAYPTVAPKLGVIRNGVDVEEIRSAQPYELDRPVVLVCGRHEPYKRIDLVIDAFGLSSAPARLVVTGSGPDTDRLRQRARASRRAADIEFLGHVETADLRRWQRSAHALVNMSTDEAFGIAAVEAVAGGATAILSDIPVHNETREVLPAGTVSVVAGTDDLVLALDAAIAAPRRDPVPVWSWGDAVAAHVELYSDLVGVVA